ncbi:esterase [Mycobacterium sp. 1274756.6]|nr:serine hydrolase domain-containing protein [Mycobacterium sp. 1274756.6]OBJ74056.1 esterase [Mycobacterium sp. 1274756.6]
MRQRGLDGAQLVLPRGMHGAAAPEFACAVRTLKAMFPGRRLGGGALAVYLDGQPVVDVWTGYADRAGDQPWGAQTASMVYSVTKGMAATVIHRLADRGLIDYDAPVAEYWPAFAANGKAAMTVRAVLGHRAGLAHLRGVTMADLLDHEQMEERVAAAAPDRQLGKPSYHALTFGWLLSGLARAVTGTGMRELIRTELAEPLNTDGLHLGRPPAEAPTWPAQIIMPQRNLTLPLVGQALARLATAPGSRGLGAIYFQGVFSSVQGDVPVLDTEAPALNGVATARGLARMYGAIANRGRLDGTQFLSERLVGELTGKPSLRPDGNLMVPLPFHLGYHGVPFALPGFGHVGLGGSVGWADPASGLSFGLVHNRLLTPFVATDQTGFVALGNVIRRAAARARRRAITPVPDFGAPFARPAEAAG